jgi:CheY-like chemotaxis protein
MDHMMPGMDGIETARAIRALPGEYFQKLPIVVLTANAIAGMRDMFMEIGFNDYISKPIEIVKLDELIARWIPGEKQIKAGRGIRRESFGGDSELFIPGVDVKQGIHMTGGTEAGYRKVLAQFYKDAAERLPVFSSPPGERAAENNNDFSEGKFSEGKPDRQLTDQVAAFATQAHAIKSAAGTIGATEVSAEAAVLEAAGKTGDAQTIRKTLPLFREHLTRLIEAIRKTLSESEGLEVKSEESGARSEKGGSSGNPHSPLDIRSLLLTLKEALEIKNMKDIDRLLEEIEGLPLDAETREQITALSDKVLMGEYQEAIVVIDKTDRVTGGGA